MNTESLKKAKHGKIENVAGSVWLSLFMEVPLLSRPLCPLQVLVGCLLGALQGCVGGLRPVNVDFALLIFILVFFFLIQKGKLEIYSREI
jgi:hypothetical protein